MGGRYLTDLADVCRRAGLVVLELDGWPTRARSSGGYATGKPDHVMVHHTASGAGSDGWPDANYCTYGDDDAPLCNLYLDRQGVVYVCAAGATNTNGKGVDPCSHIGPDSMNSSAVGIEAGNDGTGETWPPAQLDAYTALCAALCAGYGIPTGRIHGHAEWAPDRKVDPAGPARYATGSATWDMDLFRADCTTTTPPPPTGDDDMKHLTAPERAPMIVGAGWLYWARNEHEGAVMAQVYGPPMALSTDEYDLAAAIHTAPPS